MFLALVTIHPTPNDVAKVVDILDSMRGILATNGDCCGCLLAVEAGGDTVCYLERWTTRAALECHLRSSLYGRVLEAMELSGTAPTVEFFEVGVLGGLELVERVRLVTPPSIAPLVDQVPGRQTKPPEAMKAKTLSPEQSTCRVRQWP